MPRNNWFLTHGSWKLSEGCSSVLALHAVTETGDLQGSVSFLLSFWLQASSFPVFSKRRARSKGIRPGLPLHQNCRVKQGGSCPEAELDFAPAPFASPSSSLPGVKGTQGRQVRDLLVNVAARSQKVSVLQGYPALVPSVPWPQQPPPLTCQLNLPKPLTFTSVSTGSCTDTADPSSVLIFADKNWVKRCLYVYPTAGCILYGLFCSVVQGYISQTFSDPKHSCSWFFLSASLA